jgi:SecD/SecF fusion protein
MLRFSKTKIITTLGVVLIGLLLAVPSMMSREDRAAFQAAIPSWVPSWLVPTRAIVLGLDLQGGSHILLEVDQPDLIRTQALGLRDDVRRILRETGVAAEGGIQLTPRGVQLRVADPASRARLVPKLRELSTPISNAVLGQTGARNLDVNENESGLIQLVLTDQGITDRIRRAVDQSIEVIRRRVDQLGTTEPSIQRQGADRILVQLPGVQDPQRLKDIIGKTAKLEFRLLGDAGSTDTEQMPSRDQNGQRVAVERRVIVGGGRSPSCWITRSSRRPASCSPSPVARARSRAGSRSRTRTTFRCCCARAPCRPS